MYVTAMSYANYLVETSVSPLRRSPRSNTAVKIFGASAENTHKQHGDHLVDGEQV